MPIDGAMSGARRYLALGDSYTIGEGVAEADRWPEQLVRLLRARGLAVEPPVIVAKTGWTTDELREGIHSAGPCGPFDLVTLLVGVNDQYRGRTADSYAAELRDLIDRAIELAGGAPGRVLVLSIPDWGVTPFAEGRDRGRVADEIDEFNDAIRVAAARAAVRYVDVTPSSRRAAGDATLLAMDRLHPSGVMYAEWALLALEPAASALGAAPGGYSGSL